MLKGKKEIRERLLTMWPPMGDEKPTVVQRTIDYKDIPNKLRKNRQWVVWRNEKDDEGHDIVVYYHPTSGKEADPQYSPTWGSCRQAVRSYERKGYDGIAYVFLPQDPIIGVFMNDCLNKNLPNRDAWRVIRLLRSYSEYFVDGRSMLVIVEGKLPEEEYYCDNMELINAGFCPISSRRFRPDLPRYYPKHTKKRQDGIDTLIKDFFRCANEQAKAFSPPLRIKRRYEL